MRNNFGKMYINPNEYSRQNIHQTGNMGNMGNMGNVGSSRGN